ncbi:MAG: heparinase II/III family protein [Candidatus Hodarchaeota archaeon]
MKKQRKIFLTAALAFVILNSVANSIIMWQKTPYWRHLTTYTLSDQQFFALLDDRAELSEIKSLAQQRNIEAASELWKDYMNERTWSQFSPYTIPPVSEQAQVLLNAEKILNHTFTQVYHEYTLSGPEIEHEGILWHDIDWSDNPDTDKEWIWQFNRHGFLGYLARAYLITLNETYAQEYVCMLTDWIRDEPPESDWSWRTLDTSIRMGNWMRSLPCFLNSTKMTPSAFLRISKSLIGQTRFVTSNHKTEGNWMATETATIIKARCFWPEFSECTLWEEEAWDWLTYFCEENVYPDGGEVELSIGYAIGTQGTLMDIMEVANFYGLEVPAQFNNTICRQARWALHCHDPAWKIGAFGDSWPSRRMWAVEKAANLLPGGLFYDELSYFDRNGQLTGSGVEPPRHVGFNESGYFISRSAWDSNATWSMMDAGPKGTAHVHHDCLNYILYGYGSPLLLEHSVYTYSGEGWELMDHQRSARGHNLWVLDDDPIQDTSAIDSNWVATSHGTVVRGTHDYWGHPASRELVYSEHGYWIENNFWAGSGNHALEQYYQLPETDLVEVAPNWYRTDMGGANLLLGLLAPWSATRNVTNGDDGSYFGINSAVYHQKIPATTMILQGALNGPAGWTSILWPLPPNVTAIPANVTSLEIEKTSIFTNSCNSFEVPGMAFSIELGTVTDVHISLRVPGAVTVAVPALGNSIEFTGTQCVLQFNATSAELQDFWGTNMVDLAIDGVPVAL